MECAAHQAALWFARKSVGVRQGWVRGGECLIGRPPSLWLTDEDNTLNVGMKRTKLWQASLSDAGHSTPEDRAVRRFWSAPLIKRRFGLRVRAWVCAGAGCVSEG